MLCQKFFLIRFISTCCFIFLFFLNCFVTAEAGMGLGKVCFYEGAESDKKGVLMEKTVNPNGDIRLCRLDVKVASDSNPEDKIIDQFKTEIQSDSNPEDKIIDQSKMKADIRDFFAFLRKKKCTSLLIVRAAGHLEERWTLAGFDGAGEFRTVVIDEPNHELSKELEKEHRDERKIVELVTSLDRTLFVEEKGKIKIAERKQDNSYTISRGKIETESMYIINCNIEQKCNEKDCLQGVIQLVRQEWEGCYKYKLFMYPGEYDIECDQCKTNVTINHGSLLQDINFYYSGNNHSDKFFCN